MAIAGAKGNGARTTLPQNRVRVPRRVPPNLPATRGRIPRAQDGGELWNEKAWIATWTRSGAAIFHRAIRPHPRRADRVPRTAHARV